MNYQSDPVSVEDIRKIAYAFRKQYNVDDVLTFPVLKVIDNLVDEGLLEFLIVEDDDQCLQNDELAHYSLDENIIYMKSSVYLEACNNIGRAIFTLTHELAHFIFFQILKYNVKPVDEKVKTYMDPEWQANTLASEILIPYYETKDFETEDIVKKCGVSEECAIVCCCKRIKRGKQLEKKENQKC